MAEPTLFDHYFSYVEETEPPIIFHRWSILGCLSAMLGRQLWLPFGAFRIFPNQYVMLIGEPGTRKSTAIKLARRVLAKTGYDKFAAEKTSKEKFLLDLEGLEERDGQEVSHQAIMENLFGKDANTEPKEVFIVADEFNDFMRCGDLEFHSMLGVLWDYDDETTQYKQRLKNSKSIAIYQPTINLLGGNTHTNFAEMFPPQAIGQGFLSRMILVFSEPSGKKIPFPEPPDERREKLLVDMLAGIKRNMNGAMKLEPKAKEILGVLYNTYKGFDDVRFTPYFTRRYTHLLKMCVLVAASRCSMTVGVNDVILANTILSYTEHFMPKALGEFGKSRNADVAGTIMKVLEQSRIPVDIPELYKHVQTSLDKIEQLADIMNGLAQAGKVIWVHRNKGVSTSKPGYLITRQRLDNAKVYVDYELLKEYDQFKLK